MWESRVHVISCEADKDFIPIYFSWNLSLDRWADFPSFNKWVPTMCIRINCSERDSVWRRDCGMGRWWKVSVTVTLPKDIMPGPPWSLFLHWSSSHRSGSLSLRICIGGQRIQSLPWLFWDICKQVEGRKSALCFCVSCMSTCWVTRGPFKHKYRHWFLVTSKILKSGSEFLGGYGVAYRRGGKGKLPDLKMAHSTREQGGRKRQTPWGAAIQWITFSHLPFFVYLAAPGLSHSLQTLNCGLWDLVPDQGSNPGSLRWERGVMATESPGKSPTLCSSSPPPKTQIPSSTNYWLYHLDRSLNLCVWDSLLAEWG